MTGRHRRNRNADGEDTHPTDQEVNDLITRAATLLDELRATFAEIQDVLEQDPS